MFSFVYEGPYIQHCIVFKFTLPLCCPISLPFWDLFPFLSSLLSVFMLCVHFPLLSIVGPSKQDLHIVQLVCRTKGAPTSLVRCVLRLRRNWSYICCLFLLVVSFCFWDSLTMLSLAFQELCLPSAGLKICTVTPGYLTYCWNGMHFSFFANDVLLFALLIFS